MPHSRNRKNGNYIKKMCMDFVDYLTALLNDKLAKNGALSLRALAKKLAVSPGYLSELLHRKRKLNLKQFDKIAINLDLTEEQFNEFRNRVKNTDESAIVHQFMELTDDALEVMYRPHYHTILHILSLIEPTKQVTNIASALAISEDEVKFILNDLIKLGYVSKEVVKISSDDADRTVVEKYSRLVEHLGIVNSGPKVEKYIRSLVSQELNDAAKKVMFVSASKMISSSATIVCDSADIPELKKLSREFIGKLVHSQGENKNKHNDVYQLTVVLTPKTKLNL